MHKPTDEQQKIIDQIQLFIDDEQSTAPFLTVSGKGGSGKTFTINHAIRRYDEGGFFDRKEIIGAAISNAATKVLNNSLTVGETMTVTSLLNKKIVYKAGGIQDFVITNRSIVEGMHIQRADILIIDECSMIDEEELENIIKYKKSTCKLIFLGDIAQIRPINTDKMYSPTFDTDLLFELKTNMRAKKPLDLLNDFLRNEVLHFYENMRFKYPNRLLKPLQVNTEENGRGFYTLKDEDHMKEVFVNHYKENPEDPLNIKITAYKNDTINELNKALRILIHGEDSPLFVVGDNLLMNGFYNYLGKTISNNTYCYVTKVVEGIDEHGLDVYYLDVKLDTGLFFKRMKVFNPNNGWKAYMEIKKDLLSKAKLKVIPWKQYYLFMESYANVSYGYVITSHKIQGQTTNYIIVYESEIRGVKPISDLDKIRSIYVGTSRAVNKIYLL